MKDNLNPGSRFTKSFLQWPRPTLILTFGLIFGFSLGQSSRWGGPFGWALTRDAASLRLIPEAWSIVRRYYVDRSAVLGPNLAHGALAGMVAALGDVGHSTFLTPGMVKQLQQMASGQLQGVGLEVQMKDGRPTVITPLENSPAAQAGIRPGDMIVKVNGQSVEGMPLSEVASKISGAPGTSVTLTILDPSTERERDLSIVRAAVRLHSVSWRPLPESDMVLIRIARFDEHTSEELNEALVQIQRQGSSSMILDLRNNPGGILDESVKVASHFLTNGYVLFIRDAQRALRPVPVLRGGAKAASIPLAVLINGNSASAAEIVAGALKDSERATLVGETTFGTGTVLQQFPLSDGSALLIAVQEWLTPSKQSFWHKGIGPNIRVAMTNDANALTPREVGNMTRRQLETSGDAQLLRAVALLARPQESVSPVPAR